MLLSPPSPPSAHRFPPHPPAPKVSQSSRSPPSTISIPSNSYPSIEDYSYSPTSVSPIPLPDLSPQTSAFFGSPFVSPYSQPVPTQSIICTRLPPSSLVLSSIPPLLRQVRGELPVIYIISLSDRGLFHCRGILFLSNITLCRSHTPLRVIAPTPFLVDTTAASPFSLDIRTPLVSVSIFDSQYVFTHNSSLVLIILCHCLVASLR